MAVLSEIFWDQKSCWFHQPTVFFHFTLLLKNESVENNVMLKKKCQLAFVRSLKPWRELYTKNFGSVKVRSFNSTSSAIFDLSLYTRDGDLYVPGNVNKRWGIVSTPVSNCYIFYFVCYGHVLIIYL